MSASLLSLPMFSATVLDWVPFRTSLAQVGWFSVGWLVVFTQFKNVA